MQFKALFLASLAAGVLAESTSFMDMSMTMDSSMSMGTRASTDSVSHSSDDHSSKDHTSSDHSDRSMFTSVESGYTLTTDASGSPVATYTGTDTKKPKTASLASATSDSHSSTHTSDHSSSTASGSSGSASRSSGMAMATTIPMIGAAAMAGIAFAL